LCGEALVNIYFSKSQRPNLKAISPEEQTKRLVTRNVELERAIFRYNASAQFLKII